MSPNTDAYIVGQHAARIEDLSRQMALLDAKVDELVNFSHRIQGGWRVGAVLLTTIASFIGAGASLLFGALKQHFS